MKKRKFLSGLAVAAIISGLGIKITLRELRYDDFVYPSDRGQPHLGAFH